MVNPEVLGERPTIDISGLDKALVLAALYNGAKPQGAGFFRYDPTPMTAEEAALELDRTMDFDYLKGRVMKVDISGDVIDPRWYDKDNVEGAAGRFIDSLREDMAPDPNNPTIRRHHLSEAGQSAQVARELIYEDPSGPVKPGAFRIGFDNIADELDPKIREAQEALKKLQEQEGK